MLERSDVTRWRQANPICFQPFRLGGASIPRIPTPFTLHFMCRGSRKPSPTICTGPGVQVVLLELASGFRRRPDGRIIGADVRFGLGWVAMVILLKILPI